MSAERNVPEPGEQIYSPRPSWAPAFFAFGLALAVCGIYAEGFMVRGWIYSIIGLIVVLAAVRGLVRGGIRDFYRLPRKQKVRGAVLPIEPIKPPRG
ncbi:MAG TPA: hypothetical protein VFL89_00385 [Solirubrobacterales bacterium]|nr:hypothetical protein [Solirubrobacterales bacterium]